MELCLLIQKSQPKGKEENEQHAKRTTLTPIKKRGEGGAERLISFAEKKDVDHKGCSKSGDGGGGD